MIDFFINCKTIEEAKSLFRKLLILNHPDHAGKEGEAVTLEIIKQYNAINV